MPQGLSTARALAAPAVRLKRELVARFTLTRCQGDGPLAVFLPSAGRAGAALLRIYNIAEHCPDYGWRAFVLPSNLSLNQRIRLITAADPDVLVMQGVRHPLNRPGYYPNQTIVFDMDDADFHLSHLKAALLRAMPDVAAVVAGSDYVADWCRRAGAPVAHTCLTGMPVSTVPRAPQAHRPPIVAWAQTRPMTYHREAALVLEVMTRLVQRCPGVRLRLYDHLPGDDPGFLDRFRAAGIPVEWRPAMDFSAYLASFDDVALGLAPLSAETPFSRGKSVGKVLAYLDRHVPIIASDAGEHRKVFQPGTGIVSNDPDVWVCQAARLLAEPRRRQALADRAFAMFQSTLSVEAATRRMAGLLDTCVAQSAESRRQL